MHFFTVTWKRKLPARKPNTIISCKITLHCFALLYFFIFLLGSKENLVSYTQPPYSPDFRVTPGYSQNKSKVPFRGTPNRRMRWCLCLGTLCSRIWESVGISVFYRKEMNPYQSIPISSFIFKNKTLCHIVIVYSIEKVMAFPINELLNIAAIE